MCPEILSNLLERPVAQSVSSRHLDEAQKDGAQLLVENPILPLDLGEGLQAEFRGPLRPAGAHVEGEDIKEVEQDVLVVALLQVARKRLAEEDLRLAPPTERLKQAGRRTPRRSAAATAARRFLHLNGL